MRLLTRSDFDGLICAVLLKEAGLMDEWKFVHPKDVQDGKVEVTQNDILANVPFAPGCGMWFDHHSSEEERLDFDFEFKGASRPAPSCARVIWEHFGATDKFPERFQEMLEWVDRCDSGQLSQEEIENPEGWVLLSFIMDPRTGLGRYQDYRISNYQLMMDLVEYLRTMSIADILELDDVKERIARYFEQNEKFKRMLAENAEVHGNAVLVDLRYQDEIYTGNRFLLYSLFPEANISVQVIWGLKKMNTVITVGHSILNRTSRTDVGRLMLAHGGGGHRQVGTCQVPNDQADRIIKEILEQVADHG